MCVCGQAGRCCFRRGREREICMQARHPDVTPTRTHAHDHTQLVCAYTHAQHARRVVCARKDASTRSHKDTHTDLQCTYTTDTHLGLCRRSGSGCRHWGWLLLLHWRGSCLLHWLSPHQRSSSPPAAAAVAASYSGGMGCWCEGGGQARGRVLLGCRRAGLARLPGELVLHLVCACC